MAANSSTAIQNDNNQYEPVCGQKIIDAGDGVRQNTDPQLVDELWNRPDDLVENGQRLVEKQCVRTTVRIQRDDQLFVVKRHRERSWRHFAKQCVSISRAARCWRDTWFLIDNGYPTPLPVAYVENRLGPLRGNSFYAYRFVEGVTFKQAATGLKNQRLLRQFVNGIADIWLLHRKLRINLSDGHPANFVIDPTGQIWVIDLDKLQRLPRGSDADRILMNSFTNTIRGVIGDRHVLRYAEQKLQNNSQTNGSGLMFTNPNG